MKNMHSMFNLRDTTLSEHSGFHFINRERQKNNTVSGNRKQSGTSDQQQQHQQNTNELPKPSRVLYPRERIRIGWKQSERKWQVGTGLLNVGNTCYLNSTLQALFHIPALANWLVSETGHVDNCNILETAGCCIICAMIKTLLSTQTSNTAVRPFHIYTKLKQICKHMQVGHQEDAHEFLRFLVEAMEKAYLMRDRNYKELDQLVKETTPLNQIFGGYLRSAVRCLSCNHVSITFQHFQDLLLDIRKADTLEEAFDGYFARERLEDMGYKCEGCKKKVSATKQFSLERAPITLCIQLKRFNMMGNKLTKQITFKPRIDLSKYAARSPAAATQPLTYRLVSLVTHLGVSQHCGHYTAIGLTEAGGYYNFDDSYVRPIQIHSVCNTNAYIMFYELDTPAAPARSLSTQPSAATSSPKINGLRLSNGQHSMATPTSAASTATSGSSSVPASPTRFIGPQLPPGGLNNGYTSPAHTTTNGFGNHSASNPKIAILYKNSSLWKQATASSGTPQKQQQQLQQNGLLVGTGKFQEPAYTKSALAGASHKSETAAIANGNKSSSSTASHKVLMPTSSDDDDVDVDDNKVNRRSGKVNATPQLPSMPKLFGTTTTASSSTPAKPKLTPLKSLVPYESASEEEEPVLVAVAAANVGNLQCYDSNPRKRRSGEESSDSSEEDATHTANGNGNHCKANGKSKPHVCSSTNANNNNNSKQKTDAIDEIFKSLNNYKNKHKSSPNTETDTDDGDDEEDDDDERNKKNNNSSSKKAKATVTSNGWRPQKPQNSSNSNNNNCRAPPSPKTPPSPAVIKSKTGIWQVSRSDDPENEDETEDRNSSSDVGSLTATLKNPKNPFATKPATATSADGNASKRQKLHNGSAKTQQQTRLGNGYQNEANNANAVGELLKQSHRGYGSSVLTWNGKQTELDKELEAEAREQRQRDQEDDEENEMDRGRQRKVKSATKSVNSTPGYNPFQEYQENQKRWHKPSNGGGGYPRAYNQNYRQNFQQRNKFKFNRFSGSAGSKFQQRALQRHLAAGGGFTRRQQQHHHAQGSQQQQSS
ncbi:ubiquitin carboxyl-terminal hydrolase 36 isoform X2 [Scaptodrosophila lebanonensis]|uniref:Ubiquitin carboxyl-terminal hydrolase 36 n=1 Tax=Drosophila lebanonensis TaxID=7225 RepID=A0A6J2TUU2_DROLE|nr:ubiquitin carboxyl-terminal hydrolase 36 isoform X2 [Scaptodrosophila lebanonensis]